MFITKKFIEKVHDAFDELNYHETKRLDFESFEKSATKTLTHAKELSDAIDVVLMYQFCLKKWNKIEKILLSIAKVTCASTSCIGLYEPKMPEKLLKKTKRNSK